MGFLYSSFINRLQTSEIIHKQISSSLQLLCYYGHYQLSYTFSEIYKKFDGFPYMHGDHWTPANLFSIKSETNGVCVFFSGIFKLSLCKVRFDKVEEPPAEAKNRKLSHLLQKVWWGGGVSGRQTLYGKTPKVFYLK